MAWFETKLTQLTKAIQDSDWEKATAIYAEHSLEVHSQKAGHDLELAAGHITRYFENLRKSHTIMVQDVHQFARKSPPSESDRRDMLQFLDAAQHEVKEFERLLKKVNNETQFIK